MLNNIVKVQVDQAIDILRNGGVVVYPTETAYGFAVDATNFVALEKLVDLKGREFGKTFPLIVDSVERAEEYFEMSDLMKKLAEEFWPGPLTIVSKAKESMLHERVVKDDGTVAIRVSSSEIAHALAEGLGKPITSTSANVSGGQTCYSVECVKAQFVNVSEAKLRTMRLVYYLDGGELHNNKPSTIVKEENGKIVVLRQGLIEV